MGGEGSGAPGQRRKAGGGRKRNQAILYVGDQVQLVQAGVALPAQVVQQVEYASKTKTLIVTLATDPTDQPTQLLVKSARPKQRIVPRSRKRSRA